MTAFDADERWEELENEGRLVTIDIGRAAESLAGMIAEWYGNAPLPNARISAVTIATRLSRFEAAAALSSGWRSMASAPRKGNVLLDLGETIPSTPNARVGKFISEAEAATFHETLSSAGGWIIWNADDDWFVVPFADAVGWMPLPTPQGEQG